MVYKKNTIFHSDHTQVSEYKLRLRNMRNRAIDQIEVASSDFNKCRKTSIAYADDLSVIIFRTLLECFEFVDIARYEEFEEEYYYYYN